MIELSTIPAFAALDRAALESLATAFRQRSYASGQALLRRGEAGGELFILTAGLAGLRTADGREVDLGPGEVLGEISAVLGLPVSATVRARKDTTAWVLERAVLERAMREVPGFEAALLTLARSRRKAEPSAVPHLCFLVDADREPAFQRALREALDELVPASVELCDGAQLDFDAGAARIAAHRSSTSGAVLLISIDAHSLATRAGWIERGDAVLHISSSRHGQADLTQAVGRLGLGDHGFARILERPDERAGTEDRWHFRIVRDELESATSARAGLARIARWIARRRVGLALSAGAARGFAHLGVLAGLEDAGIPIDVVCGTSIGGIVGLLYGMSGSADGARRLCEQTIGSNALVRRASWFPRASFLSGRALRDRAWRISEGRSFADLAVRVAVVTSDLVHGERFVLDRGPVAPGLLATAAIPGALPPIEHADRLLVDGALVSRIPLELLDGERCGLRIAVNVLPPLADTEASALARWRSRFRRFLGLRDVIGRSWEILSWWKGANDAEDADVLIEPRTGHGSGFDFDATPEMISVGRAACEEQLPRIRRVMATWDETGADTKRNTAVSDRRAVGGQG